MFRFVMGMFLAASAASGVGFSFVMGSIGLGIMLWGFYSLYRNGELQAS